MSKRALRKVRHRPDAKAVSFKTLSEQGNVKAEPEQEVFLDEDLLEEDVEVMDQHVHGEHCNH